MFFVVLYYITDCMFPCDSTLLNAILPLCRHNYVKYRATTHTDLVVRAKKLGVAVEVVHNASVMNAIGVCGLQLYRYGETISLPFFTETWKPDSFYEKIQRNRALGLHTLCLLGNMKITLLLAKAMILIYVELTFH